MAQPSVETRRTPEWAGCHGGMDESEHPATVSLKPARPVPRPDGN
jgi:hypothetical protein